VFANPFSALAETPQVVVSLRPLHSLVSMVMEGVAAPSLLLDGPQDPHHFHLRPSQMRRLKQADLVFYMDPGFELFLKDVQQSDTPHKYIPLSEVITSKAQRHDHHWLNPSAARAMLVLIAKHLSAIDAAHAKEYHTNATRYGKEITTQDKAWQLMLHTALGIGVHSEGGSGHKSVISDDQPHIAADHDTFLPFTRYYHLPDVLILKSAHGALNVKTIHQLEAVPLRCILIHTPADDAINQIAAKKSAKIATVDTLGVTEKQGTSLYTTMMGKLVQQFASCLTRP